MFQLLCVHIIYASYIWHYSFVFAFWRSLTWPAVRQPSVFDFPIFSCLYILCVFVPQLFNCHVIILYVVHIYIPQFTRFYFLVLSPLADYLIAICFHFPISFYLHNLCVFVSLRLFYNIHGYVWIRSFYIFWSPPLCLYYSPLFLFPVFFLINMFSVCSY